MYSNWNYKLHGYSLHKDEIFASKDSLILTWRDTGVFYDDLRPSTDFVKDPKKATLIWDDKLSLKADAFCWPSCRLSEERQFNGGISGTWTGRIWSDGDDKRLVDKLRLIQLQIETVPDSPGTLTGSASTWANRYKVAGKMQSVKENSFILVMSKVVLTGRIDVEEEVLRGFWRVVGTWEARKILRDPAKHLPAGDGLPEEESAIRIGFEFRRTPTEIYHLRNALPSKSKITPRSRWRFAQESVLFLLRRNRWSWDYFKCWGADRRTFLVLYKRVSLQSRYSRSTHKELTQEEEFKFDGLKERLSPSNIRACVDVTQWYLDRLPRHL
jgi:hypothetical protein